MEIITANRVFKTPVQTFPDPDPTLPPEDVLKAPCVRIDVASFKETLLAYRGRNEENDDDLSRRIQSQDHCPDAAAA